MIDRRAMLAMGAAAGMAGLSTKAPAEAGPAASVTDIGVRGRPIRVVDLTHRLSRAFAFTPGRLAMEPVRGSGADAGMLMNRLCIVEHTGTHLDAPRHFDAEGKSVGDLAIADLVVPLVVIDLRDKRAADRDARVEPEDILRWERRHGPLPAGACVAMLSGWRPLAEVARYAELSPADRGKSPGFGEEAGALLMERGARGIAVDTLSLDPGGEMPAYPLHRSWLRSGRWGLEAIANLDLVPANGATLFVGAPPIADATGVPIRAIALF